jgi:hypothetical protein
MAAFYAKLRQLERISHPDAEAKSRRNKNGAAIEIGAPSK